MRQDEAEAEAGTALLALTGGGVSITAASSSADLPSPALARALGCRVSADGRRLTVFLDRRQSAALLRAVERTGAIAVVFSIPSTHRSVQLKGRDARIVPPPGDVDELLAAHADAFALELAAIGFEEDFARALLAYDPAEVTAVEFAPGDAFVQTPGPGAGCRIGS